MQIGDQFGHADLAEKRAVLAVHPDAARRGDPDIASAVALHAVRHAWLELRADARSENAVGAERAVGIDVERPYQAAHRIVDIKDLLVGREAEPVRLLE